MKLKGKQKFVKKTKTQNAVHIAKMGTLWKQMKAAAHATQCKQWQGWQTGHEQNSLPENPVQQLSKERKLEVCNRK